MKGNSYTYPLSLLLDAYCKILLGVYCLTLCLHTCCGHFLAVGIVLYTCRYANFHCYNPNIMSQLFGVADIVLHNYVYELSWSFVLISYVVTDPFSKFHKSLSLNILALVMI